MGDGTADLYAGESMTGALRGGLAALVLGVAVGAAMAQQPSGWLPTWLGGKSAVKPMDKPDTTPDKMEVRKHEREALMNAYLRRMSVCIRLRQVAFDTNNSTLEQEADRLEDLAKSLYQQRSGQSLAEGVAQADEPKIDKGLDDTRNMLLESAKKNKSRGGNTGRGGIGR